MLTLLSAIAVVFATDASAAPVSAQVSAVGVCAGHQGTSYPTIHVTATASGLSPNAQYIVGVHDPNFTVHGEVAGTTNAQGALSVSADAKVLEGGPSQPFMAGTSYTWRIQSSQTGATASTGTLVVQAGACSTPTFPVQSTTSGTGTPWYEQPSLLMLFGLVLMFGAGVLGRDKIRAAFLRGH